MTNITGTRISARCTNRQSCTCPRGAVWVLGHPFSFPFVSCSLSRFPPFLTVDHLSLAFSQVFLQYPSEPTPHEPSDHPMWAEGARLFVSLSIFLCQPGHLLLMSAISYLMFPPHTKNRGERCACCHLHLRSFCLPSPPPHSF